MIWPTCAASFFQNLVIPEIRVGENAIQNRNSKIQNYLTSALCPTKYNFMTPYISTREKMMAAPEGMSYR